MPINPTVRACKFRRSPNASPKSGAPDPRAGERGWALLSVLWVTAMLTMMAAATQALTLTSVRFERRALERARVEGDLDAGVVRAILALDDQRVANRWRVDGFPYPFAFDGIAMTVSVQDQGGLFDINEDDDSTLEQMFTTEGVDMKSATALTARIIDWRTEVGDLPGHSLNGGTDADYAAARLGWRPRHGAFPSIDELNLVLGMTPALLQRIRPLVTVYAREDAPDPNVAPRDVLEALHPGNENVVDTLMQQRLGALPFGQGGDKTAGLGILATGADMAGQSFGVTVTALVAGHHFERRAIVETTADQQRPYLVQVWE